MPRRKAYYPFSRIKNEHAGLDFLHARIMLGDITWHGHIEIHTHASDWQAHKHHLDPAYENVILHVAWDNDQPIQRKDNTILPTLSLKNRISANLGYHQHSFEKIRFRIFTFSLLKFGHILSTKV